MVLNISLKRLSTLGNKLILGVIPVIIVALTLDTSILRISSFLTSQYLSYWRIFAFTLVVIIYVIGQLVVLRYVKQKSRSIRADESLRLGLVRKVVTICQYALSTIIVFISLEVLLISYYHTDALLACLVVSCSMAIIIMGMLSSKLLSWFRFNRNPVVFLYFLSAVSLTFNIVFTLIFVSPVLILRPGEVFPSIGGEVPVFEPTSVVGMINYLYIISSIISFVLTWIATGFLLRHYSKRLGNFKYWVLLGIPLVYFLSQFLSLFFNLLSNLLQLEPIFFGLLFTMIFSLTKPAGGILFGIAFRMIGKNISQSSSLRDYLIISGYGFTLFFISNQGVILLATSYPPFGLITVSFVGLSSYLIMVGIYSSAISVSQDVKLRQYIREFVLSESKLLDSIGTAQMEQEIRRKVMTVAKLHEAEMVENTGVDSSLDESEVKDYLAVVLREIEKSRRK